MIKKLRKYMFPLFDCAQSLRPFGFAHGLRQEKSAKGEGEKWDIVDGELIVNGKPVTPSTTNGESKGGGGAIILQSDLKRDNDHALPEEKQELRGQGRSQAGAWEREEQAWEGEEENISKSLAPPGPKGRPKKIEGFFQHLQAAERSMGTIQGYKKDLRFWEGVAKDNRKTVYTLTVEDIEKAVLSKRSSRKRRLLAMLKSLAKYYLRVGFPKLHLECQKIVLGKKEVRIPKAKDKQAFIRIRNRAKELCESGDRRGVWLGLMLMCGLRISEIQTATVGKNFVRVIGKGNKERQVPCPAWLITTMTKIPSVKRGGYAKRREVIDPRLRELGFKKFHSLRHTYATMLLHEGYTINEIQKLLGHASIATTQIYTKTKMPRGVVEVLDGI